MDFGKLSTVDGVDFALPAEPSANTALLAEAAQTRSHTPVLYIGPTGYNMRPWNGKWYPADAKEKDFLKYYGRQFNTIEHNTTHYRIPDEATVNRWREDTPADFRFAPKIPQTISHSRNLGVDEPELMQFCRTIRLLGPKLGCSFLQLPPYFEPRDLHTLIRFLERWPEDMPLAVEVRHASFFNHQPSSDRFFGILYDYDKTAVVTDVAGRRDVCHLRLTNATAMVRFVGNALHPSDYSRVEEWTHVLQRWMDKGLHQTYFFTHEPDNLLAPELAAVCYEKFSAAMPDVEMRSPTPFAQVVQGSLF